MFKVKLGKQKMKNATKQKNSSLKKVSAVTTLAIATVLAVGFAVVPRVTADTYDEQIKALQQENSTKLDAVSQLQSQASSYQDAINKLQGQINELQGQINANVAKQTEIQNSITANQAELDKQRGILGENIRVMYVEGQITTIEMLATSKNLSEFVDKEEYRNTVKNKIQATLQRINDLQNQLKEQKAQVDKLLIDQKNQQADLDKSRSQQASMLAYNTAQQNDFNSQINANQGKITNLRHQQAIENAKLGGVAGGRACDSGNGDTYPAKWCTAPLDSMLDNWGMYNRECVSYTAWKVYESGRYMPYWGGVGNANQWDDNARAAGIPVDTTPRDGDVAIKNSGTYGHALYVEHAYGDGSILVSDYNQQYDGVYRRYTISRAKVVDNNLQFIHF